MPYGIGNLDFVRSLQTIACGLTLLRLIEDILQSDRCGKQQFNQPLLHRLASAQAALVDGLDIETAFCVPRLGRDLHA
jgi:hypothetical protein